MRLNRTKRAAVAGAAAAVVTFGTATVAVAEVVPDGHNCWWNAPSSVPNYTGADHNRIVYSQGVQCDGLVRAITITVELLYHGLVAGPGSGDTVNGQTQVQNDVTQLSQGVNTLGETCETGYYSGRATATVQYRSGTPEFITASITSAVVSLTCAPPPIPVPPPPPPDPTPTASPTHRDRFPGGRH